MPGTFQDLPHPEFWEYTYKFIFSIAVGIMNTRGSMFSISGLPSTYLSQNFSNLLSDSIL